jgi:hypothetical protein
MNPRTFRLILVGAVLSSVIAFSVLPITRRTTKNVLQPGALFMSEGVVEDDDEEVEPGEMRVSEIKAELTMRGVTFEDCFEKDSLAERLMEARATGKANPDILNEFNKKKLEENFSGKKMAVSEEDVERIKANDGTLPGGMNPEMLTKLMEIPEIMTLLQSSKMQEAMKMMMTGGPEELEAAIKTDPELQQVVEQLNSILGGQL